MRELIPTCAFKRKQLPLGKNTILSIGKYTIHPIFLWGEFL